MSENIFHRAIYLTGPTASGKTAVGVALARRLDAEVVALDSMTLYRGMDIATAKPTLAERGGVPHHLIDVIDPWESASVSAYREWAAQAAGEIEARGKRVLFVGGTPALLEGAAPRLVPGAGRRSRASPAAGARRRSSTAMPRSTSVWPRSTPGRRPAFIPTTAAGSSAPSRSLELTGRPISELQAEHDRPAPPGVPVFALELPRASLHDRINRRVVEFFEAGLVEEVRALQSAPNRCATWPRRRSATAKSSPCWPEKRR